MPLKIAIDLDCTVLNTTERLVEYINERVPVNLKIEDIMSYSIEAALPKQYQWIVDSGFRDKEMWRGVQVLPYAADVIKKLYDEGHEIFFATSSLPENLRKKINHLSTTPKIPPVYDLPGSSRAIRVIHERKYKYNIYYTVDESKKKVHILRIFHARQSQIIS